MLDQKTAESGKPCWEVQLGKETVLWEEGRQTAGTTSGNVAAKRALPSGQWQASLAVAGWLRARFPITTVETASRATHQGSTDAGSIIGIIVKLGQAKSVDQPYQISREGKCKALPHSGDIASA